MALRLNQIFDDFSETLKIGDRVAYLSNRGTRIGHIVGITPKMFWVKPASDTPISDFTLTAPDHKFLVRRDSIIKMKQQ